VADTVIGFVENRQSFPVFDGEASLPGALLVVVLRCWILHFRPSKWCTMGSKKISPLKRSASSYGSVGLLVWVVWC
jgi:hypothetical protein